MGCRPIKFPATEYSMPQRNEHSVMAKEWHVRRDVCKVDAWDSDNQCRSRLLGFSSDVDGFGSEAGFSSLVFGNSSL